MHHAIYVLTNALFFLFWAVGLWHCTRFVVRRVRALRTAVRRRRGAVAGIVAVDAGRDRP